MDDTNSIFPQPSASSRFRKTPADEALIGNERLLKEIYDKNATIVYLANKLREQEEKTTQLRYKLMTKARKSVSTQTENGTQEISVQTCFLENVSAAPETNSGAEVNYDTNHGFASETLENHDILMSSNVNGVFESDFAFEAVKTPVEREMQQETAPELVQEIFSETNASTQQTAVISERLPFVVLYEENSLFGLDSETEQDQIKSTSGKKKNVKTQKNLAKPSTSENGIFMESTPESIQDVISEEKDFTQAAISEKLHVVFINEGNDDFSSDYESDYEILDKMIDYAENLVFASSDFYLEPVETPAGQTVEEPQEKGILLESTPESIQDVISEEKDFTTQAAISEKLQVVITYKDNYLSASDSESDQEIFQFVTGYRENDAALPSDLTSEGLETPASPLVKEPEDNKIDSIETLRKKKKKKNKKKLEEPETSAEQEELKNLSFPELLSDFDTENRFSLLSTDFAFEIAGEENISTKKTSCKKRKRRDTKKESAIESVQGICSEVEEARPQTTVVYQENYVVSSDSESDHKILDNINKYAENDVFASSDFNVEEIEMPASTLLEEPEENDVPPKQTSSRKKKKRKNKKNRAEPQNATEQDNLNNLLFPEPLSDFETENRFDILLTDFAFEIVGEENVGTKKTSRR